MVSEFHRAYIVLLRFAGTMGPTVLVSGPIEGF